MSITERLHLLIHLSGCSVCRLFQKQSRMINQLVRSIFQPTQQPNQTLDDEVKRDMQRRIDERLNK